VTHQRKKQDKLAQVIVEKMIKQGKNQLFGQ
jgi:hypothetical protein